MNDVKHLTPSEIVAELDKFIIGQDDAKRAVAVAVRNRWRRQQLDPEIRDEVAPKNIIMVGPTGVGKTEIARRLAGLAKSPFVKVEATKFTEVGYVGRDVEGMVRDLLERAIQIVHHEMSEKYEQQAQLAVEKTLLDYLLPHTMQQINPVSTQDIQDAQQRHERSREKLREQLRNGTLEDKEIEIEVEEKAMPVGVLSNIGMDQFEPEMQNFFDKLMPSRSIKRRLAIREARKIIYQQELEKFIDKDKMIATAISRTEQAGIVFLDEIDKICGSGGGIGPDVSREGVQRDLLPLVEGSTVNTRHGMVRTDHILFIAAGAFSRNKPSDLMPELQGRFPIRVKLQDLDQQQFCRILTEPKNALITQQIALLKTEGVELNFTADGIETMAQKAYEINLSQQNIGARRLYAIMEKVLEQVGFDAPDKSKKQYTIDADYVKKHLSKVTQDEDLNVFGFAAAMHKDD
jgi:ATP-dependent HslUV protease ATP-binding subunit HslU